MSQRLRERKNSAGRKTAGGGEHGGAVGAVGAGQVSELPCEVDATAVRASRADQATIGYILSMTREMKRMAQKAGLVRVALILEMAELEALDQSGGKPL